MIVGPQLQCNLPFLLSAVSTTYWVRLRSGKRSEIPSPFIWLMRKVLVMESLALSIKMSILLYLPIVAIILLKRKGLTKAVAYLCVVLGLQFCLAAEFLNVFPLQYLKGSFDFSRQF